MPQRSRVVCSGNKSSKLSHKSPGSLANVTDMGTDNITTGNATLPSDPEVSPWWELTLICIITTVAILANLLVICAFILDRHARTPFNYYLINLAVSDFLVGIMGMTNYGIYTYYKYWPLSYDECSAWLYFDFLSTSLTLQTLAIISLDRLWAVTLPVSYRRFHHRAKSFIAIGCVWTLSNVLIVPSLSYYRHYIGINENPRDCYWDPFITPRYASPFYVTAFIFWTPTIVTVLAYCVTTFQIRRKRLFRTRTQIQDHGASIPSAKEIARVQKDRQVYFLLSLLLAALLIMWSPYFCYEALSMSTGYYNFDFFTITYWMAYCLSAINPFLFNWGSPEMQNALRRLARCFGQRIRMRTVKPSNSTVDQNSKVVSTKPY